MTTSCCDHSNGDHAFPYLAFIPVIAALSGALVLILRSRRGEIRLEQQAEIEGRRSIRLPATPTKPKPDKPDELTLIEGIGPKIFAVLIEAGITHFGQLAALKPDVLKEVLVRSGNRLSDPTTWPEQARLAAEGKWDELKKYQESLKGGRKA